MADNSEGYSLKFSADFSQVRRDLQALQREVEQTVLTMKVAAGGVGGIAGAAAAGQSTPAGRIVSLSGTTPDALTAEDARREQRIVQAASSSDRVERAAAAAGAIPVIARRTVNVPGAGLIPLENLAQAFYGGGFGGGAPPTVNIPNAWGGGLPMLPGAAAMDGGFGGGGGGSGGGGGLPPVIPGAGGAAGGGFGVAGGGTARSPGINWGRIGMLATVGYGVALGDRFLNASTQYNIGMTLAGNDPSQQYGVETRFYDTMAGAPLLGPIASAIADPGGFGRASAELTMQDVESLNWRMGIRRRTSDYLIGERNTTSVALARGDWAKREKTARNEYGEFMRTNPDRRTDAESAILQTRRSAEAQAEATWREEIARIDESASPSEFGQRDPETLRARADADGSREASIQRARDDYQIGIDRNAAKFQKAEGDASARLNETIRVIDREKLATLGPLHVESRVATLRAFGMGDAATMAGVTGQDYIAEQTEENPDRAIALHNRNRSVEGALSIQLGQAASLRGAEYRAGTANYMSRVTGDTLGATMAGIGAENLRTLQGAQLGELPAAVQLALSRTLAGAAGVGIQWRGAELAAAGAADASGFMARGDTFGAQRSEAGTRLQERLAGLGPLGSLIGLGVPDEVLNHLYSPQEVEHVHSLRQSAIRENVNTLRVVDRGEGLYMQRLGIGLDVSQARATGTEAGGYELTAGVRQQYGDVMLAAAGAPNVQSRDTILRTGANLLTATRRDLQTGGSFEEVAAGTSGPGFEGSGDQEQAVRETNQLLQQILDALQGGGGTDSPGEDLDNH